ncbi:MAG TPA: tyrosine-type recombinase/integrase [Thermoanaerobaculia bacterium]|nr:tyrosine-type recombinase/integrase [Thermoanaerobaculia bacterium]
MPILHLTDRALRGLSTNLAQEDYYDESFPAFGVRISRGGGRSFFVRFRFQGKNRRVALGSYPAMTLAEARGKARAALGDVARGIDPGAERDAVRSSPTFATLIEEYMERHAKVRQRSWQSEERMLKVDLLPALGSRRIAEIRRGDLQAVFDAILDRGAPVSANRTFQLARRVFNFAVRRSHLEHSPCAGLKKPSVEKSRDRVLSAREIHQLWLELEQESVLLSVAIRVLLLTAQRAGEVLEMRYSEVEDGVWRLSQDRTRAKRLHLVPLSEAVKKEIARLPRSLGCDWVFPSPRKAQGPLGGSALSHTAQRLGRRLGFTWRPHDLRRTAASLMAQAGVNRFILARVLNHADASVTAIHDRHSYLSEKRQALELLATEIESMVGAGHDESRP